VCLQFLKEEKYKSVCAAEVGVVCVGLKWRVCAMCFQLDNGEEMVRREISVLRVMHHPRVCRLYEVLEVPGTFVLIFELLRYGYRFAMVCVWVVEC